MLSYCDWSLSSIFSLRHIVQNHLVQFDKTKQEGSLGDPQAKLLKL